MTKSTLTWGDWLRINQAEALITIPEELRQSDWQPTEADRKASWLLYTELRTRIATQPLHYRSGDEETALDSLYQLFAISRDAIKGGGPECRHFATLASQLLNTHLRPLTARWHKKKIEGRLLNDDERREFRRELNKVRKKLLRFCQLLGRLSAGNDGQPDDGGCIAQKQEEGRGLGAAIRFERHTLPEELFQAERNAIRARRGDSPDGVLENLVGLACSGGGIRSATLCLGVVQTLAKRGLLPRIDYLSTVSGGGYFGAFLSSYLNSSEHDKVGLGPGQLPFAETGSIEPTPVRKLRNNSKYLLAGGLAGQARMAGLLLFGIVVNLLALLPVLFAALTLSKLLELFKLGDGVLIGVLMYAAFTALVLMIVGLPLVYRHWAEQRERVARYERWAIGIALFVVALWILGYVAPWLYQLLLGLLGSPKAVVGGFLLLPFLLAGAGFAFGAERLSGRVLLVLAGIAAPLLVLMAFYALDEVIGASWNSIDGLLLASALLTAWLLLIDMNRITPHRYYRNRLAEAYLLQKQADGTYSVDPQPLSQLRVLNPSAPYHLINAAVNLPASGNPELRGRHADFFLFTQDYCGSPLLGYSPTKTMEQKDHRLDLGTAMATSGAAASSFMGTSRLQSLAFWLALLNVRLAYWLPNPSPDIFSRIPDDAHVGLLSLWRELTGKLDENNDFVNLSDGGHIENLGIYELLRRRAKFIIAIDGEADPTMQFGSLMQLIRYAQIDLDVCIHIDLDDLRKNAAGYSKAHFTLGEIDYGPGQTGFLLYLKSSLTGNERDYVLDYQRKSPSFPHESTADQFFSEAQFEAYRALGEHMAGDLFQQELVGEEKTPTLEEWFSGLVRNLLVQPTVSRKPAR